MIRKVPGKGLPGPRAVDHHQPGGVAVAHELAGHVVEDQPEKAQRPAQGPLQAVAVDHAVAQQREAAGLHRVAVHPEELVVGGLGDQMPQAAVVGRRDPGLGRIEELRRDPRRRHQQGVGVEPAAGLSTSASCTKPMAMVPLSALRSRVGAMAGNEKVGRRGWTPATGALAGGQALRRRNMANSTIHIERLWHGGRPALPLDCGPHRAGAHPSPTETRSASWRSTTRYSW